MDKKTMERFGITSPVNVDDFARGNQLLMHKHRSMVHQITKTFGNRSQDKPVVDSGSFSDEGGIYEFDSVSENDSDEWSEASITHGLDMTPPEDTAAWQRSMNAPQRPRKPKSTAKRTKTPDKWECDPDRAAVQRISSITSHPNMPDFDRMRKDATAAIARFAQLRESEAHPKRRIIFKTIVVERKTPNTNTNTMHQNTSQAQSFQTAASSTPTPSLSSPSSSLLSSHPPPPQQPFFMPGPNEQPSPMQNFLMQQMFAGGMPPQWSAPSWPNMPWPPMAPPPPPQSSAPCTTTLPPSLDSAAGAIRNIHMPPMGAQMPPLLSQPSFPATANTPMSSTQATAASARNQANKGTAPKRVTMAPLCAGVARTTAGAGVGSSNDAVAVATAEKEDRTSRPETPRSTTEEATLLGAEQSSGSENETENHPVAEDAVADKTQSDAGASTAPTIKTDTETQHTKEQPQEEEETEEEKKEAYRQRRKKEKREKKKKKKKEKKEKKEKKKKKKKKKKRRKEEKKSEDDSETDGDQTKDDTKHRRRENQEKKKDKKKDRKQHKRKKGKKRKAQEIGEGCAAKKHTDMPEHPQKASNDALPSQKQSATVALLDDTGVPGPAAKRRRLDCASMHSGGETKKSAQSIHCDKQPVRKRPATTAFVKDMMPATKKPRVDSMSSRPLAAYSEMLVGYAPELGSSVSSPLPTAHRESPLQFESRTQTTTTTTTTETKISTGNHRPENKKKSPMLKTSPDAGVVPRI